MNHLNIKFEGTIINSENFSFDMKTYMSCHRGEIMIFGNKGRDLNDLKSNKYIRTTCRIAKSLIKTIFKFQGNYEN